MSFIYPSVFILFPFSCPSSSSLLLFFSPFPFYILTDNSSYFFIFKKNLFLNIIIFFFGICLLDQPLLFHGFSCSSSTCMCCAPFYPLFKFSTFVSTVSFLSGLHTFLYSFLFYFPPHLCQICLHVIVSSQPLPFCVYLLNLLFLMIVDDMVVTLRSVFNVKVGQVQVSGAFNGFHP